MNFMKNNAKCFLFALAGLLVMAGCIPARPHEERRMLQAIRIESEGGVNENITFKHSPPLIRTRRFFDQCFVQYRSEYPESIVTDEELIHTLVFSKTGLVRDSDLIS